MPDGLMCCRLHCSYNTLPMIGPLFAHADGHSTRSGVIRKTAPARQMRNGARWPPWNRDVGGVVDEPMMMSDSTR